jgi:hypothetical protein
MKTQRLWPKDTIFVTSRDVKIQSSKGTRTEELESNSKNERPQEPLLACAMSALQQRARDSGKCPPSLLTEDRLLDEGGVFEAAVLKILDPTGTGVLCGMFPSFSLNLVSHVCIQII